MQRITSLHLHRLKECRVHAGPVQGPIRIEQAVGCTFSLASRQIRIHDSRECRFYLYVCSNPIIENCTSLQFSSYNFEYTKRLKHFKDAGLDQSDNKWSSVEDFKWLKSQHSPNWSIMPEDELFVVLFPPSAEAT
mmetsp:Transcript_30190/g.48749  ORF Transcript_30190/g.48749 Transcript_30190/m.48749 type:complete len:135 (+) Transcript_30190:709-1113(+)